MKALTLVRLAATVLFSLPSAFGGYLAPNGVYVYTSVDDGLGGGPSRRTVTDLYRVGDSQTAATGNGAYGNAGLGDVHAYVKARSITDGSFSQIAQSTVESQFQDTVLYQNPLLTPGATVSVTGTLLVSGSISTPASLSGNLGVATIRYLFEAFDSFGELTETQSGFYNQTSSGWTEGANFIGLIPVTFSLRNQSTTTFHFVLGAGVATSANNGMAEDMMAIVDLSHSAHWQGLTLAGGGALPGELTSTLGADWFAVNNYQPYDAPEPGSWLLLGSALCATPAMLRRLGRRRP